jgi:hypothetical protein
MILSFRHKGLKRLFEEGDRSKVQAAQADKIERISGPFGRGFRTGKFASSSIR